MSKYDILHYLEVLQGAQYDNIVRWIIFYHLTNLQVHRGEKMALDFKQIEKNTSWDLLYR